MYGSAERAPADVVIYQSMDREGATFALSPDTKRALQQRFGSKFHAAPRIFIAHGGNTHTERLHGSLSRQLLALLTGLDDEQLVQLGQVEFRDPVTDQQL